MANYVFDISLEVLIQISKSNVFWLSFWEDLAEIEKRESPPESTPSFYSNLNPNWHEL
jgi:hypothetical protein